MARCFDRTSRSRELSFIVGALAALLTAACGYRVREPATPTDTTGFIIDYGIHSSLVLPRTNGLAVEFAYGQWQWFVENRTQWYRALPTILLPGQAALGRRELGIPATLDAVTQRIPAEAIHPVAIDSSRAAALIQQLDQPFGGGVKHTPNPVLGLDFVPDRQIYSLFYHCNSRVAEWLRALDCRVRGLGPFAEFTIERAPELTE